MTLKANIIRKCAAFYSINVHCVKKKHPGHFWL